MPAGGNSQFYFVAALPDSVDARPGRRSWPSQGYSEAQIAAYAAAGGLPYLDNTDTVFGQVYAGHGRGGQAMACVETVQGEDGSETWRPTEEAAITIEQRDDRHLSGPHGGGTGRPERGRGARGPRMPPPSVRRWAEPLPVCS